MKRGEARRGAAQRGEGDKRAVAATAATAAAAAPAATATATARARARAGVPARAPAPAARRTGCRQGEMGGWVRVSRWDGVDGWTDGQADRQTDRQNDGRTGSRSREMLGEPWQSWSGFSGCSGSCAHVKRALLRPGGRWLSLCANHLSTISTTTTITIIIKTTTTTSGRTCGHRNSRRARAGQAVKMAGGMGEVKRNARLGQHGQPGFLRLAPFPRAFRPQRAPSRVQVALSTSSTAVATCTSMYMYSLHAYMCPTNLVQVFTCPHVYIDTMVIYTLYIYNCTWLACSECQYTYGLGPWPGGLYADAVAHGAGNNALRSARCVHPRQTPY